MKLFGPAGILPAFHPLLLERSYGGGGELVVLLLQSLFGAVVVGVVVMAVVKLSNRAEEVYEDRYHKFLKRVGIVAVLFVVVYALASIGSH